MTSATFRNLTRQVFAVLAILLAVSTAASALDIRDVNLAPACGGIPVSVDVFAPPNAKGLPIVMVVHGGGWVEGDKSWLRQRAMEIGGWGFVTVNINYPVVRNYPLAPLVAVQVQSIRCVRTWLDYIAPYIGGNAQKVGIVGHSAGGQLATEVAILEGPSRIRAFVSWGGKYDMVPLGGADIAPYSPLQTVRASTPPGLLIAGLSDPVIPWQEAAQFRNKAVRIGNPNITLNLIAGGHDFDSPYYLWWTVQHFYIWMIYR